MESWSVVLPVKGAAGKSRLEAPGMRRAELAVAFALDTLDAVRAARRVGRILVVTADAGVASRVAGRAEPVADPGAGLNAAIRAGLARLDAGRPAAALLADLPALAAAELDAALQQAAEHPLAMVADAAGTGTTLATALRADRLLPRFGPGSRDAHERAGHVLLDLPRASGLRLDVDDAAALEAARALGVGEHTARALSRMAS